MELEVTRNTLLDLGSQSNSLTQMIASMEGEITDELFDQLFSLNEATEAKIESYAWTMDRLEYEAHFWKERAAIYTRIIKNLEKTREKMRERLKMFIEITGKAQGIDSEFRLVESGSHLVIGEVSPEEIPEALTKTRLEFDKEKIKQALLSGADLKNIKLVPTIQLRKFIRKREIESGK